MFPNSFIIQKYQRNQYKTEMRIACVHVFIPLLVLVIILTNLKSGRGRALDKGNNLSDNEDLSGGEQGTRKPNGIMGYIGKKKDKLVEKLSKKKDEIVDEIANKTQSGVDLVQNTISDVYQKVLQKKLNYTDKLVTWAHLNFLCVVKRSLNFMCLKKFLAKNGLALGGLDKIMKTEASVDSLKDPIVKNVVK